MAFNPYYAQPQRATGYQPMNSFTPQNIDFSGIQKQNIPNNPYSVNAGQAINAGVGAISAGFDFFGDIQGEIGRYENMRFQSAETMINGVPNYSGVSDLNVQQSAIDPSQAGKGLASKGMMAGAQAGSSFGTLGAGIGAFIGTGIGMFGQKRAEEAAEQAQLIGQKKFLSEQNEYNEDVGDYFNTVDYNRQDIQGERNRAQRQYGLGQYNDPFKSIV